MYKGNVRVSSSVYQEEKNRYVSRNPYPELNLPNNCTLIYWAFPHHLPELASPFKILFCLQLEMAFKMAAWAISKSCSGFLGISHIHRRYTCS